MEGDKKCELPISWAELHHDLLCAIYKRLDDTFDFINFRAVCKWWRAAASLFEQPPQFPLLLEREYLLSPEFKLYSLCTGKVRRLRLPEAENRKFVGQSQGYLVTFLVSGAMKYASPALLNPITRAELPLPFRNLKPYYAGPNWPNYEFYKPLYVGADPIRNPSDLVIYMGSPHEGLCVGFRKSESNEWALKHNLPRPVQAYHKGKLFFLNYIKLSTMAIDLTTGETSKVICPYDSCFSYIVEGGGSLLGIEPFHLIDTHSVPLEKCWFKVYRLAEEEEPPRWVKTTDIGDLMIFLNSNDGFCLSAGGFNGISGNCIYFTRPFGETDYYSQLLIGRHELGKEESEVIARRWYTQATWIVPNLY